MKRPKRKRVISTHRKLKRGHCLRIFRRLSEYLDGEISSNLCKEIERHLKGCANCCAFFNTFKKTVELCKSSPPRSLPKRVRMKLLQQVQFLSSKGT
jgi:RNA polymerase sigma-70 factor (ECF subfamily)